MLGLKLNHVSKRGHWLADNRDTMVHVDLGEDDYENHVVDERY